MALLSQFRCIETICERDLRAETSEQGVQKSTHERRLLSGTIDTASAAAMHNQTPLRVIRYRSILMPMSGSTGSGHGPNCEIDVMGHLRTHAVQKRLKPFAVTAARFEAMVAERPKKESGAPGYAWRRHG